MWSRLVIVAFAVDMAAGAARAGAAQADAPGIRGEVRALTADLQCALTVGLERSETLRALVQEIERRDGIVVVESANRLHLMRTGLVGATFHNVIVVGARRLVRVTIVPGREDVMIATLAHELQHAAEILASNARSRREVNALYERIGYSTGPGEFETEKAREIGRRVGAEVRRNATTDRVSAALPPR